MGKLLAFAIFIILFAVSPYPFAIILGAIFEEESYCKAAAFRSFFELSSCMLSLYI